MARIPNQRQGQEQEQEQEQGLDSERERSIMSTEQHPFFASVTPLWPTDGVYSQMHTDSPTPFLYTLTDRTLISLSGPQAHEFLQGQVTCDVRELNDRTSRLGAHCNPKGRMLFSFRAIALADGPLLLQVPSTMVDIVTQSLGKYIVFSKAELEPAPERFQFFGLAGQGAADRLARHWLAPATAPGDRVSDEHGTIITLSDERYELWIAPHAARALIEALSQEAQASDSGDDNNEWQRLDIQTGLGAVLPQTSGLFAPQALNFPALGAVSFHKGCYTGQEIVARLHYKGKLKQQLRQLAIEQTSNPPPAPGAAVHSLDSDGSERKKVGQVVLIAQGDQSFEALAVLDDSALEQPLSVEQHPTRVRTTAQPAGLETAPPENPQSTG